MAMVTIVHYYGWARNGVSKACGGGGTEGCGKGSAGGGVDVGMLVVFMRLFVRPILESKWLRRCTEGMLVVLMRLFVAVRPLFFAGHYP